MTSEDHTPQARKETPQAGKRVGRKALDRFCGDPKFDAHAFKNSHLT